MDNLYLCLFIYCSRKLTTLHRFRRHSRQEYHRQKPIDYCCFSPSACMQQLQRALLRSFCVFILLGVGRFSTPVPVKSFDLKSIRAYSNVRCSKIEYAKRLLCDPPSTICFRKQKLFRSLCCVGKFALSD